MRKIIYVIYLDSLVKDQKTLGIQYLVLNRDSILFSHASGLSNISKNEPMTLQTPMMFYSITKVLTATAIMQLVQNGRLSLDDSLNSILPWAPYHTTIRLILCHSGGIPNAPIGNFYVHKENDLKFNRKETIIATCKKHPKIIYKPGTKTMYSNLGFALLGEVIEARSGESYEHYISNHIFQPVGIDSNEVAFSFGSFPRQSKGYIRKYSFFNFIMGFLLKGYTPVNNGKWKTFKENWYMDCPAQGGAIGLLTGLSKYLQDMISTHSTILSDSTRNLLFTIQRPFKSSLLGSTEIAFSWFNNSESKEPYFFHEGSAFGYVTEIRIYPTKGIISMISLNGTDRIHKAITDKVNSCFLQ